MKPRLRAARAKTLSADADVDTADDGLRAEQLVEELEIDEQVRWAFDDGGPVMVALRFEPSKSASMFGRLTATLTEGIAHGWYNEHAFSLPARKKPRSKELKLTVSSNLVVRGPMQPWELEILTPLIREFILEIVGEQGAAGASVSVLADRMHEAPKDNVGQQQLRENDHGDQ